MAGLGAPSNSLILPCIFLCFLFFAPGVFGFGAGNIGSISKVEGVNWRHGDIEDTLLTLMMSRSKKFSKLDVKRVYFGNWLRDYSQAVDVGTVKMVSAEAIRLLLWILGFLSFGYATKEFEVTRDRLGCYRPEEHIDNPKDYADNIDARQYDTRLRAPIDERRELAVDERTGMKNYIAAEDMGITTSAGMVRDIYRRCIELARRSRRSGNNDELYEAYRLLGTANHCLEDFSAHSNYTELCLIEMGERDIFPHVGRRTQIQVRGARDRIWPLITGTFGGVDFLHSVMGELSDKTVQNEITELEGTVSAAEQNRQSASVLKDILDKLPDGLFGGNNESEKVDQLQANTTAGQMQNMTISPKDPEEFTKQAELIRQQIYPVLEFHDEIMHGITETIEKIPILPDLLENLQEQVNVFVFSLIAPFILPVIKQVKAELSTGSSEVIQSSMDKQHVVFNDDNSTDPTHSMISKDHFTNVLNEPAGKVASQVLKWVVPQIVACWDDDRADVDRTINRIINGIFHHPALREQGDDGAREARQQMFHVVENWWREKSDRERDGLRDQLSRQGVEQGRNHKEGVHDSGHGCGKPLGMPNLGTSSSSGAIGGVLGAGLMGGLNQAMGGQQSGGYGGSGSGGRPRPQEQLSQGVGKAAGEAVGGGLLGNIVGGVVGGVGSSLLGGAFDEPTDEHKTYKQESHGQDGSYTQSYTETARRPQQGGYGSNEEKYGQAEYKRTDYPGGGRKEEYSRYEQDGRQGQSGSGYGFKQSVESKPTYDGGYERTEEKTYERPGGQRQTETRTEGISQSGDYYTSDKKHHGGGRRSDDDDEDKVRKKREKAGKMRQKELRKQQEGYGRNYGNDEDSEDSEDSNDERKHREKKEKKRQKELRKQQGYYDSDDSDKHKQPKHHGRRDDDDDDRRQQSGYGQEQSYGGRQEQSSYGGRQESSGYGQQESYGGRQEGSRQQSSGYGQQEEYGGGRQEGYGGGRQEGYGRQEESGHGGRRGQDDDDEVDEYGERRRRHHGGGGGY